MRAGIGCEERRRCARADRKARNGPRVRSRLLRLGACSTCESNGKARNESLARAESLVIEMEARAGEDTRNERHAREADPRVRIVIPGASFFGGEDRMSCASRTHRRGSNHRHEPAASAVGSVSRARFYTNRIRPFAASTAAFASLIAFASSPCFFRLALATFAQSRRSAGVLAALVCCVASTSVHGIFRCDTRTGNGRRGRSWSNSAYWRRLCFGTRNQGLFLRSGPDKWRTRW